jgi:protein phosphatase
MKDLALDLAALSDKGLVSKDNQDAVAIDLANGSLVLADGVGGRACGAVASRMAVDNLMPLLSEIRFLCAGLPEKELARISAFMREGLRECNQALLNAARAEPRYQGMASTVVMGLFAQGRLFHCHLGDSRIYRLRQGILQQLTKDHTQVQEHFDATGLFDDGIPANAITRALGVEGSSADCGISPLQSADVYLFCSDGISKDLSGDDLTRLMGQGQGASAIACSLIDQAKAKGGRDNITVAVACV